MTKQITQEEYHYVTKRIKLMSTKYASIESDLDMVAEVIYPLTDRTLADVEETLSECFINHYDTETMWDLIDYELGITPEKGED